MAYHDDLLEQAAHLAHRDPRRPKQANLRRAVSTAYYALFHLLVSEAVGQWRIERHRDALARAFEHKRMKGTCSRCSAQHSSLKFVADTFVDLQRARHDADYSNAAVWTKLEVNEYVRTANKAFEQWKHIRTQPASQDFLLSLLIPERS